MAVDVARDLASGFAHRFIQFKVRQLIGRHGFTRSDREDLEQELRLVLWQRRSQFDPEVAHWRSWVSTIVERQIATLLEARCTEKRGNHLPMASLSQRVVDPCGEIVELGDVMRHEHRVGQVTQPTTTPEESAAQMLEVGDVIAGLPLDLQRLCETLRAYPVVDAAARELGLSRGRVRRDLVRLREVFAQN